MTKFPVPTPPPRPPAIARKPVVPTGHDPRWAVSPLAVAVWLLLQAGCLALGLLQVPLAASNPAGSSLFPELVIAGQVFFAATLAPLLVRSPATLLVVIGSCWPPLLLAGGLAARTMSGTILAGIVISAWMLTLFFWVSSFDLPSVRQLVSGVAIMLAAAPLVLYLVTEFAVHRDDTIDTATSFVPTILAWNCVKGTATWPTAMPLGLLLLLGLAVWAARGRHVRSVWQ